MNTIRVDTLEYSYIIGFFPDTLSIEEANIIRRTMDNVSLCNRVAVSVSPDGWVGLFVGRKLCK